MSCWTLELIPVQAFFQTLLDTYPSLSPESRGRSMQSRALKFREVAALCAGAKFNSCVIEADIVLVDVSQVQ